MHGRFTGAELDLEFIEVLQTQCFKFIKQEGDPTLDDISNFIHDKVSPETGPSSLMPSGYRISVLLVIPNLEPRCAMHSGHFACAVERWGSVDDFEHSGI